MTYTRFLSLIKDAAEFATEEQFIGEVGFPDDIELDGDNFSKTMHIIYTAANGNLKDVLAGYKLTDISRAYAIPYRTLQNWVGGQRTALDYIKYLITYTIIGDLPQQY